MLKYALTLVQVTDKADVEIDSHKITGEDDFKYKKSLAVYAVVVDKSSGPGYAQITRGGKDPEVIHTGRRESGFKKAKIEIDQSCMLYEQLIVVYIRPRQT